MSNEGFSLVLPFDTDDPEFVRGVEVGMLYERWGVAEEDIAEVVRTSNLEMVVRMAEALGYTVVAGECDDTTWTPVQLVRS